MSYYENLDIEYYFTDLYSQLDFIGEGNHPTSKEGLIFTSVDGYITIELKDGVYDLIWLNGKHYHKPYDGPAYAASVKSCDNMYSLMRSAYRFHPITDDEEREAAAQFLVDKIRQVYQAKKAEVNDV